MRGKLATKIRKEIRKRLDKEGVSFKNFINKTPLRTRIHFAFKILLKRI